MSKNKEINQTNKNTQNNKMKHSFDNVVCQGAKRQNLEFTFSVQGFGYDSKDEKYEKV